VLSASLFGAGAVLLGSSLAGCAPAATGDSKGSTTVRIWDLFSGADGANMQHMQAAAMKANPDVDVESVTLAWGSAYYTKLAMASSSGRPPEAAVMHMSRLAGYAPGGLLEPYDLDELAKVGIRKEDFAPAVWDAATYKGELYALPLDTHPFITFYNPKFAKKAGLLDADGKMAKIEGADAFLDAGRKLAKATGQQGMSFGYLMDTAQSWRLFWGLYNQTGGGFQLTPGKKAQLDEGKAKEVIEFIQAVMDGKIALSNQDYAGGVANFVSGRSGMILSGEWELPAYQAAIPKVGAMPFPTIFDKPANYADSHSFVLPKQAHPDPKRREATYRILADRPVQKKPAYQKLLPQADYASAGNIVTLDPPVWFAGAGSDFQARVCDAMSDAFQGKKSASSAVSGMLKQMDRLLSTPNPA
jgi:multiple sugar transport system substrate-binding protein